jgi:hypothetical protein
MLRITIELVPGGHQELAEPIARGNISNVSGLADMSSYVFKFEERPWQGRTYGPYVGTLSKWPRNERGAWEIVHAALTEALKS